MLVMPTATGVTNPCEETVATAVFPELHVIVRPLSIPPFTSSVLAVACDVPTAVIEFGVSDTVTEATGTGITVIEDVPVFPSLVAVMLALPTETAVTSPAPSTVAIAGLLEVHATMRSDTPVLFASLTSAENCCVEPETTIAVGGLTVTEATDTGTTVIEAFPDTASLVAIIIADPLPTAVTSPNGVTVATALFALLHVTTRPVRILLEESRGVAVAWLVWPT
jgi:hypothetical protein